MKKREEQDQLYYPVNENNLGERQKLKIYNDIVGDHIHIHGDSYVKYLNSLAHGICHTTGNGSVMSYKRAFIPAPEGLHLGPFLNEEDRYKIILGEENEKKITNNCNHELMKTIGGSQVTNGMYRRAKGERWINALIAYNDYSILIRGEDNIYGQPGSLKVIKFSTVLEIEILNRYLIPSLIRMINEGDITDKTSPFEVENIISRLYHTTVYRKLEMMQGPDVGLLDEYILFSDAPPAETLNILMDDKDRRIASLERTLKQVETKLSALIKRQQEIETVILDINLKQLTDKDEE